ncbi:MAG: NADP-dependent oxidoreductase [Acidobacteriota bacterium]
MLTNRRWTLASRPAGWVREDNFALVEAPVPSPNDGEVLVRNRWLSVDPYMRGRMSDAKSYVKGLEIGDVMVGQTVGDVLESRHPDLQPGDTVLTQLGWQLCGCAGGETLTKVDRSRAPLSYYLGMLGMTGMTAYFGLKEIGRPKAGETVVVSAAAGAVGGIVGQLAKIAGCRAVGIAGGPEKCDYVVKELGFDACVDYKAGNIDHELSRVCSDGVDIYFDNVAGPLLDGVLPLMNLASRLVVCGAIADYNATDPYAVKGWRSILINRIKVQGMIVFDWSDRYGEAGHALGRYYAEGRLKARESVVEGLERAPQALIALLKGQNLGKQLVKLA